MTSSRQQEILKSLEDYEYRHIFAEEQLATGLAFQIRALRDDRNWTQEQLAEHADKPQEMISRWENPDYGKMTISTLKALARAFDVALIVRFAPFSELADWMAHLSKERLAPPSYETERHLAQGSLTIGGESDLQGSIFVVEGTLHPAAIGHTLFSGELPATTYPNEYLMTATQTMSNGTADQLMAPVIAGERRLELAA